MNELIYRKVYAAVPRVFLEMYCHQPWAVVIAAAKRGENGLTVHEGRPGLWQGLSGNAAPMRSSLSSMQQRAHAMKPYILFFNHSTDACDDGVPLTNAWIVGTLHGNGYISDDVIDSFLDVSSVHTEFDHALLALEVLVKADQMKERTR